jgi:deazaflavin-dependent oxidoreductase (nitroreductase family)
MGILEHVGRKSGTQFRTPSTVITTDIDGQAGVAILLTYGPNRDWLKNVTAAGAGRIKRYGKTFSVHDPRVMPKAEAFPAVKGWMRPLFARMPVEQAVLLTRAD